MSILKPLKENQVRRNLVQLAEHEATIRIHVQLKIIVDQLPVRTDKHRQQGQDLPKVEGINK